MEYVSRLAIIDLLSQAIRLLARISTPVGILRWWVSNQSFVEGKLMRITNEQKVVVSVAPKTAAGNPARIDGPVSFVLSDPTICTLEPDSTTTAVISAVAPGVCQVTAEFDADLGEGVRTITASGVLEVVEAEAVVGEIVFGEPVLK